MNMITIHTALPEAAAGAAPPEWVHLVPAGTVCCVDGRGPYTMQSAQAVIDASMANGKLPIDENHAIDHAMKTGQPSPARAWIVEMQSRADGIWGRVEWSPAGVQLMAERAYKGISPALVIREGTTRIVGIVRASLINTPNLIGLTTLHTEQEPGMDPKALRAALGMPETADDAAVLARIQENATAVTTHSTQIANIARAAGVADADANRLITVLAGQSAKVGQADQMAATVVALQTQVETLRTAGARAEAERAIDAAIDAGKPITPIRDHYISRHMQDPAGVKKEIDAMPTIHAGGIGGQQLIALQGEQAEDAMTQEEMMTCQKMGVDPKAFMKTKKKMMGAK